MGWLWSTPTPPPQMLGENASLSSESTKDTSETHQSTTPPPKSLTRDELAEKELQSFLQDIESDVRPSSTKYNRVPRQPPPPSPISPSTTPDISRPLSEQLLPKTMSCRDAFDAAFYCNSMGGQFNNLYRYGTVRSCSENWNDFWFCMRTRSYGAKEKEDAIMDRYRMKERVRYGRDEVGKSSEDVWRSRERKAEWGQAFNVPFPDFEDDDEEWNQRERLRRAGRVDGSMG